MMGLSDMGKGLVGSWDFDPADPNTGHGHVRPRPDGVLARCGGPAICEACRAELKVWREVRKAAARPPEPADPLASFVVDTEGVGPQ